MLNTPESTKPPVQGDKIPALPADIPLAGETWVHWKKVCAVKVIGCGLHTETMEAMVVYSHKDNIWIRPLSMWDDQARPGVQRFTRIQH